MKKNTNLMGKLAVGVLLTLGTVFATGCAKDSKQDTTEPEGEGTRVVINVTGVNDGQGSPALKAKASGTTTTAPKPQMADFIETEGFDALIALDDKIEPKPMGNAMIRRSGKSASGGLRAEAMEQGFTYRVFLRKKGTTTLVSEQFTSGTAGSVAVEKGADYEWFALSYNNTDAVADADANSKVILPENKDVLYTKGEFTVANTPGDVIVPLNITFDRLFARIAIELNTMGMFAKMNSATVAVTGLDAQTGTVDVTTGELSELRSAGVTINWDSFTEVNDFGDQRFAYVYTAGSDDLSVGVSVSQLKIELDALAGGEERDFGATTLNQSFSFTPEAGKNHRLLVGFIESPLVRAGVSWARSNLYYTGPMTPTANNMTHNPYRFFHSNPQTSSNVADYHTQRSFFSFAGHIPRKLASANAVNQKDPCALVYPAGRWKTPTASDLNTLTNREGLLTDILGNLLDGILASETPGTSRGATGSTKGTYLQFDNNYSATPTTGMNAAYGDNNSATNNLRFRYNGLVTQIALVEDLVTLNLGDTHDVSANFWSSQQVTDYDLGGLLGGVLDLGARHFHGTDRPSLLGVLGPRRNMAAQGLAVLNIDLLGAINVISSPLQNVRCVRDNTWDPNADPMPDLSEL